ncbi:hypothetical protein OH76DRAFT_139739 [Lentinus brumalis]|uniref:Uncharacterized protein n=1 Tax=Lentinus brumalis TaxID=2498619 RepID=A0A371CPE0_9APHY|nr:hypothetical protein OH76DRAFT_139739 [Polyporus brumalis]
MANCGRRTRGTQARTGWEPQAAGTVAALGEPAASCDVGEEAEQGAAGVSGCPTLHFPANNAQHPKRPPATRHLPGRRTHILRLFPTARGQPSQSGREVSLALAPCTLGLISCVPCFDRTCFGHGNRDVDGRRESQASMHPARRPPAGRSPARESSRVRSQSRLGDSHVRRVLYYTLGGVTRRPPDARHSALGAEVRTRLWYRPWLGEVRTSACEPHPGPGAGRVSAPWDWGDSDADGSLKP